MNILNTLSVQHYSVKFAEIFVSEKSSAIFASAGFVHAASAIIDACKSAVCMCLSKIEWRRYMLLRLGEVM